MANIPNKSYLGNRKSITGQNTSHDVEAFNNRPQSSLSMNAPHNSQGYLVMQAQTNVDKNSINNTP